MIRKTVLITGGTGFIGSHLAAFHAKRNDRVYLMDNFFKTKGAIDPDIRALLRRPNVRLLKVDMTKPIRTNAIRGRIDVVYHLAAINGTRLFYEIPYQVARTNLLLTLNLLDWLKSARPKRLVYTSTSEVYADSEAVGLLKIPTDEKTPVVFTQPMDDRFSYGSSKFMGEFLCLRFGRETNIPTSVVRYHNIYGPRMGDKHVIPEFVLRILKKENPFKLHGGSETRAFCYIDDAVRATHAVGASRACADETVHIGNQRGEIQISKLARAVMDEMDYRARFSEKGRRSHSVSRRCPNTTKLKRLTGFSATVPLRVGLKTTIAWYRDRFRGKKK